jgi:histidine ammonia-lyase
VDALVDGPDLVYGRIPGWPPARRAGLREALRRYQDMVVLVHEGAIALLPTAVVRAAMAVRLAGIARGGSGVSLPVAEGLAASQRGVHPGGPHRGLVGAADLICPRSPRCSSPRPAEHRGETLAGARRCAAPGWNRLASVSKDGLTSSPPTVSVGQAVFVVEHAQRLARTLTWCCTLDKSSPAPLDRRLVVLAAKPKPGQAAAGASIRGFLGDSEPFTPASRARSRTRSLPVTPGPAHTASSSRS